MKCKIMLHVSYYNMKPILLSLLLMLVSAANFCVNGQGLPKAPSDKTKYSVADPVARAKAQADKLKEQLELSDEQYEKILEIHINAAKQNSFSGTPEENQAQVKLLQAQKRAAIIGWLNDRQTKLFNELYPAPAEGAPEQTGNVNTISIQPIPKKP